MIYSRDLTAAIAFYRDVLGFELLEEYRAPFGPVYARLKPSQGDSTIALHLLEKGKDLQPGAIRLYCERQHQEQLEIRPSVMLRMVPVKIVFLCVPGMVNTITPLKEPS